MKMFKGALDNNNKTEKYINQIYQRGVWAVVHIEPSKVFTIGHIPSGLVFTIDLVSEDAICLCKELANIDEQFDNTCEFGTWPKFCKKISNKIKEYVCL